MDIFICFEPIIFWKKSFYLIKLQLGLSSRSPLSIVLRNKESWIEFYLSTVSVDINEERDLMKMFFYHAEKFKDNFSFNTTIRSFSLPFVHVWIFKIYYSSNILTHSHSFTCLSQISYIHMNGRGEIHAFYEKHVAWLVMTISKRLIKVA